MSGRLSRVLVGLAYAAVVFACVACLEQTGPGDPEPDDGLGGAVVHPPDWSAPGDSPNVEEPQDPPLVEPPVDEPPVEEPPLDEPPVEEPPVEEPPVEEPPVVGDWQVLRDELIYAGQRGVSPDPPPSLAVSGDGTADLVFAARAGINYQPLYALESEAGWQRYGDFTSGAHFAFGALAAGGTEAPALRVVVPQYSDFLTEVWAHGDGIRLLDTAPLHAAFAFSSAAGLVLVGKTEAGEIAVWREAEGTSLDVLADTGSTYTPFAAALGPDGTAGVLWYDSVMDRYHYTDSLGRDDEVAAGLGWAWYAPPVLAYDNDGTAVAAIARPDQWPSMQVTNLLFTREADGDWSERVLREDPAVPTVAICPQELGEPCAFTLDTYRVVALWPETNGVTAVVRKTTYDAHYERQCVSWEANPEGCIAICADEGGPQGAWGPDHRLDGVAATAISIGGSDISLPGAPLSREISAVRDALGHVHLATYDAVDPEDWSAGDNVRYILLAPEGSSAPHE